MESIIERFKLGDRRAAARLITYIENDHPEKDTYLEELYNLAGKAAIIGITGTPGAGKSSLVEAMVKEYRQAGLEVGVIAVDPTSPFSGGALLGDRIRMQNHATDPGVFIRSMGARGKLGGVAQATGEAAMVLDAFGMDIVIIETVGVGQSEVDIMNIADSVLVVLNPGGGDTIQTFKAGIMEIADIFVVNKCDLPGAHGVMVQVRNMLDIQDFTNKWRPPVIAASTYAKTGLEEIITAINEYREYRTTTGKTEYFKSARVKKQALEILTSKLKPRFQALIEEAQGQQDHNPYTLAKKLLDVIKFDK